MSKALQIIDEKLRAINHDIIETLERLERLKDNTEPIVREALEFSLKVLRDSETRYKEFRKKLEAK